MKCCTVQGKEGCVEFKLHHKAVIEACVWDTALISPAQDGVTVVGNVVVHEIPEKPVRHHNPTSLPQLTILIKKIKSQITDASGIHVLTSTLPAHI
jgi:hypothetical protein